MDYYSRFLVIHKLEKITARHVKSHMQTYLSENGQSDTHVSDNGSCYNAAEFRQAMEDMGVHDITSSPHYHQLNEWAEKSVHIVKVC